MDNKILKGFFGAVGVGYIITLAISLLTIIGTTSKPSEVTWLDAGNIVLAFLAFHWSIDWIKGMFKG